jgi:hypothetical protein
MSVDVVVENCVWFNVRDRKQAVVAPWWCLKDLTSVFSEGAGLTV